MSFRHLAGLALAACLLTQPCPAAADPVLSELNGNIQDAFNDAGVAIMSPHYNADTPQPLLISRNKWFPKPSPAGASPS